ncbi:HAMP domain-containing sensor histidine kinase [Ciceribacter sp. RN22]|uniref:sensor histidine kinase n=1 Tax=Ciceribacter sp. RN22 TaxID=2954932 RepID=UPI0020923419|nr:HAMP domain-containing sensor histidine kinase [Ciceribacter sp. RN22]MCO6176595.1 HAMP domain-containing histidine kinase [Ciceribacter sp. RN22]
MNSERNKNAEIESYKNPFVHRAMEFYKKNYIFIGVLVSCVFIFAVLFYQVNLIDLSLLFLLFSIFCGVVIISLFFINVAFSANLEGAYAAYEKIAVANEMSNEARRRTEEANMAKSRFIASISHEVRNPLNAILGYAEIMKNGLYGEMQSDRYKSYVSHIHESGTHMLLILNSVLDISKIEEGKFTLKEEVFDVHTVIGDAVAIFSGRAELKGVCLYQEYGDRGKKICADKTSILQILLNILSNSVKFTKDGGSVFVRCGCDEYGDLEIVISDTGVGIAESDIPRVLSAYGQGSLAIKDPDTGTGLGLSIVQAFVALHGGRFRLKSQLNEGTVVTIILPGSRISA